MDLLAVSMMPFTIAIGVVLAIVAIEIAGLLFGAQMSAAIDSVLPDFEVDIDPGPLSGLLTWLSFGRLPALVVIMILLASFGLIGLVGQSLAELLLGSTIDIWAASALAGIGALFATRHAGRALARVFPRDESDAISGTEFVGRIATVFRGEARLGAPAEAKLVDSRGKTQYILVEPDEPQAVFGAGSQVLLVRQEGSIFRAVTRLPPRPA